MILNYDKIAIKNLAISASKYYQDELDRTLNLEDYIDILIKNAKNPTDEFMGSNTLYKKIGRNRIVRIAPPIREIADALDDMSDELEEIKKSDMSLNEKILKRKNLLQSKIKPVKIVELKDTDDIWWGDTMEGVNIRFGLLNNDKSRPAVVHFDNNCVHGNAGGETGQGKSVMDDCILMSWIYEYPPWELQVYFIDAKMAEGSKYNGMYKVPTIKDIGMTGTGSYASTIYKYVSEEMTLLYSINSKLEINSLTALRGLLDMAIPRTIILHDEMTETTNRCTSKELELLMSSLTTIVNQGRAVGDHLFLTTQTFAGVLNPKIQGQFSLGLSVGANEDISNNLIGNNCATELKKKRGYCIVNNKRNIKNNSGFNLESKVAFCPTGKEEGQKVFLNLLKTVSDFANDKGISVRSTAFSEESSTSIKNFNRDFNIVKSKSQIEIEKLSLNNLTTLLLGDGMIYTGTSEAYKEYLIWNYEKKSNLFLHTTNLPNLIYLSRMVGKALESLDKSATHYAIIDKAMLFKDDILNLPWKKDYTGDFNVDPYLNDIEARKTFIRYGNICRGEEKSWNFIDFLDYLNSKGLFNNSDLIPEFKSTLNKNIFEKAIPYLIKLLQTRNIFNINSNNLTLRFFKENNEFYFELYNWLLRYNLIKSKIKKDYLRPEDLPIKFFWFFGLSNNDGIKDRYGNISDNFNKFLTEGPEVGLFSILIVDELESEAKTVKCCKHLIASTLHSSVAKYDLIMFKENLKLQGKLFSYTQCENTDMPAVYFKRYYTGKDLTNINF